MNAELIEKLAPLVKTVMNAGTACPELKAACEKWLAEKDSVGIKAATLSLIEELQNDVTSIDGLLGFLGTDAAKEHLGTLKAAAMKTAAEAAKANGETTCICPACQAGAKILAIKDQLLAD